MMPAKKVAVEKHSLPAMSAAVISYSLLDICWRSWLLWSSFGTRRVKEPFLSSETGRKPGKALPGCMDTPHLRQKLKAKTVEVQEGPLGMQVVAVRASLSLIPHLRGFPSSRLGLQNSWIESKAEVASQ